jgi:hypothetical protein
LTWDGWFFISWGIDFKMASIITYQESFKIFMKKTIESGRHLGIPFRTRNLNLVRQKSNEIVNMVELHICIRGGNYQYQNP